MANPLSNFCFGVVDPFIFIHYKINFFYFLITFLYIFPFSNSQCLPCGKHWGCRSFFFHSLIKSNFFFFFDNFYIYMIETIGHIL